MKPILYKTYIIEEETHPWAIKHNFGKIRFHKPDGKIFNTDSIEEAKDMILEKIMMEAPPHFVETKVSLTKFNWIEDAIKFASKWNGSLLRVENI